MCGLSPDARNPRGSTHMVVYIKERKKVSTQACCLLLQVCRQKFFQDRNRRGCEEVAYTLDTSNQIGTVTTWDRDRMEESVSEYSIFITIKAAFLHMKEERTCTDSNTGCGDMYVQMSKNQAIHLQPFAQYVFDSSHSPNICVIFLIHRIHISLMMIAFITLTQK